MTAEKKVEEVLEHIPNWVYWAIAIFGVIGVIIVLVYLARKKEKAKE